jgi:hypothetical protein
LRDGPAGIPRDWLERVHRDAAGYAKRIAAAQGRLKNSPQLT